MENNFRNEMKSDEKFSSTDMVPLSTVLCDTGNMSVIRVTDKVNITKSFDGVCGYQNDLNSGDLTMSIDFAFKYFDSAT